MQANHKHRFASRQEAGRKLSRSLTKFSRCRDVVVLGLPNGGVPVAAEIARMINKPFDIRLLAPITLPETGNALGVIADGGVKLIDCARIDRLQLSDTEVRNAILRQSQLLAQKEMFYRGRHPTLDVADQTVILVDDGTTPCETIRAAIRLLRRQYAERVVLAVPVVCREVASDLRREADEVVTLAEPETPAPVDEWFLHFPPTTSAEVRRLLAVRYPGVGPRS